eukprot:1271008-Karenia_brevis.AAC.1
MLPLDGHQTLCFTVMIWVLLRCNDEDDEKCPEEPAESSALFIIPGLKPGMFTAGCCTEMHTT